MTICAGMLCIDGVVLCADSLETVGNAQRSVNKLVELPLASDAVKAVVVCATENAIFSDALIERIGEALDRSDGTFSSAKRDIEGATNKYCKETWRTIDDSHPKPLAKMLIGLKTVDDLRLLHLCTPTVRAIDTWEFIGSGEELGIYKAKQYRLKDVPVDTAAPILAYIVDVVANNAPFCGGPISLAIMHPDGNVEHKTQDYIAKTTQGYKSIGWLLDTWVFPFLPLMVSEAGEDALSMIGKLGEPKFDWAEKIPWMLQILKDRKEQVLAGLIPAIPEKQKQNNAFHGIPYAARIVKGSAQKLHEQNLIGESTKAALDARCDKIITLSGIIKEAIDSDGAIDHETIRETIERVCLFFTTPPTIQQLKFDEDEDGPGEVQIML